MKKLQENTSTIDFGTDKQTIYDLNIFPKIKGDPSIFDYYNQTRTQGGRDKLEKMMKEPLSDLDKINDRISNIKFIYNSKLDCALDNEYLDFIGYYLDQGTPVLHDNYLEAFNAWMLYKIKPSNEYYIITKGLDYLRKHLILLIGFIEKIDKPDMPGFFRQLVKELDDIMESPDFVSFLKPWNTDTEFRLINRYDSLIRKQETARIKRILKLTYTLDVYLSVAKAASSKQLCFPVLVDEASPRINVQGFFHPFIEQAVKNDFDITNNKNLCFVSGANMAGKSTFLKTIGLCAYLAHIGFPVPAGSMESTVFNGIYTTINISDDINKGYSHYYSEVKRVKDIALLIKEKKKLFVIFDELFRGTNVKDAHDATLMVAKGFTRIKSSLFFISTHIVEVGEKLKGQEKVIFKCFESSLDGDKPVYDYKLVDGISSERLGLTILKNEQILEIIDEITKDASS